MTSMLSSVYIHFFLLSKEDYLNFDLYLSFAFARNLLTFSLCDFSHHYAINSKIKMKTAKLIETNKNGKTNTRICSLSWCHSYLIFYSMTASFCQTERSFG